MHGNNQYAIMVIDKWLFDKVLFEYTDDGTEILSAVALATAFL